MVPSLGVAFLGEPAVPQMVDLARHAEEIGYESVWTTETRFTRDGFVPAAAISQATEKVRIGTAVVNVYTRGAALLGVTFATLDEASGGRSVLGLGPGSPLILQAQGYAFDAPLGRLREYVVVVRELLQGGRVSYDGEHVRVQEVSLDFAPCRPDAPIILGVTGPKALELAGEVADGVLLNAFVPEGYYGMALARLEAGRLKSDVKRDGFEIAGVVVCSVDDDAAIAKDRARPLVAIYLANFPNIARQTGYSQEELAKVRAEFSRTGPEGAAKLVPDEWVDALTVSGAPEECQERLQRYFTWGLENVVITPIANTALALDTFQPLLTDKSGH